MNGKGELHHITDAGIYSCLLGITMKLNLNDLQLELPSQVYHEIEIEITQALLERDKIDSPPMQLRHMEHTYKVSE